MMAFGGNGPLFAAAIARELGITQVIIPPMPGLFSAFGLLLADIEHHLTRSLRFRLDTVEPATLQEALDTLLADGDARLARDGFPPERRQAGITVMARYVGQSSEIAVPLAPNGAEAILATLPEAFGAEHARLYGFRAPPGEPIEVMGLALLARGVPEEARLPNRIPTAPGRDATRRNAWFEGVGWVETPVIDRAALPETGLRGPLIVQEYDATCLVPPDVTASLDRFGNIRLTL